MNRTTIWAITIEDGEFVVHKSNKFFDTVDFVTRYKDLKEINTLEELTDKVENMGVVLWKAREFRSPLIEDGKTVWEYRQGARIIHLFDTNLPISYLNYVKNLTDKDVIIKCSNGVFALPSRSVLITNKKRCLNTFRNAKKYEIEELKRAERKREKTQIPEFITEQCPYCEQQVEIASIGMTKCSNCGKWLIPCSLCNCDEVDCSSCITNKIAMQKNSDDFKGFHTI